MVHAKNKCIAKWEKKIAKLKLWNEKYGNMYPYKLLYPAQLKIAEEAIKDLKRLTK